MGLRTKFLELTGVRSAEVDYPGAKASVATDRAQPTADQLRAVVESMGYSVTKITF